MGKIAATGREFGGQNLMRALRGANFSMSHNLVAPDVFEDIESRLPTDSTILIVGCGDGGAGVSKLSTEFLENNVVGSDIRRTDFTDMFADAHNLPYRDKSADAVVCQAVLEHVRDADRALDEILRVLKPGGYLFIDVPFLQGYHGLPHDYRRFTLRGLENELEHLERIESGISVGPTTTFLWIATEYFSYLFSFGNATAKSALSQGLRLLFHRLKYFDEILVSSYGNDETLLKIPSAVYWYGQKSSDN